MEPLRITNGDASPKLPKFANSVTKSESTYVVSLPPIKTDLIVTALVSSPEYGDA